jgi:hypothetical protein
MIGTILACTVVLVSAAPFAAYSAPAGVSPPVPSLELRRALDLAEAYIARNRIDLSRQHLRSASLLYDNGIRKCGYYWHFQWAWTTPAMGGEYGLRVYMDGSILPERSGP